MHHKRAIESLLVLRELFRLPYRQTEGLARSLVKLMQADVAIPDYTSLAKRAAKLRVSLDVVRRFYGDGAYDKWKVYGTSAREQIACWATNEPNLACAARFSTVSPISDCLSSNGVSQQGPLRRKLQRFPPLPS